MAKLSDLERELQQLRTLLYELQEGDKPKPIRVPSGTGKTRPGDKGRCVVCDHTFAAKDTIVRCENQLVCRWCSPHIRDWELERYAISVYEWSGAWKQGDSNVLHK